MWPFFNFHQLQLFMPTPVYLKSCVSAKCVERHALFFMTLPCHMTRFHGKSKWKTKLCLNLRASW